MGAYVEPPGATGVVPGQGFWIIAKDAASIAVAGRSTDLASNLRITLRPGFNQISNPFSFPIAAMDLILPAPVERNLISWTSNGYVEGNATLSPLVGYWIKNNGPGNQTMEIPFSAPPSMHPHSSPPIGALAEGDTGWSVRVSARAGSFIDADHRFGMRDGATDAKDAFDFSDPPPPPAGYVAISLVSEAGVSLISDYREAHPDGAQWLLRFSSDQAGRAFRIAFDPERELPEGFRIAALGASGLRSVDLSQEGALLGTVGDRGVSREWTIVAGTAGAIESARARLASEASELALSRPISNPGDAPALDLALPEAARVTARVFDVRGRLVRTLVDEPMPRGHHAIVWDGDDAGGRRAADGVYFIRVVTGARDESRKVVLRR